MSVNEGLDWRTSTRCDSGTCVEVAAASADHVVVRHSADPHGPWLAFTRASWMAFIEGVRAGQFDPR
jgi:hypothetical protein